MNSESKRKSNILVGLVLTFLVFSASLFLGKAMTKESFLPKTFFIGTGFLIGAWFLIKVYSKKGLLVLPLEKVKLRVIGKLVLTVIIVFVLVNIISIGILRLLGLDAANEGHIVVNSYSPWELLIFVVFYASLNEELLFRGFLQNYLKDYANRDIIKIANARFSMPVIVSALAFGLGHLSLLESGSIWFVIRVVIFAFCVGLTAGYYQEKYGNFWLSFLVHSLFNLPAVFAKMV